MILPQSGVRGIVLVQGKNYKSLGKLKFLTLKFRLKIRITQMQIAKVRRGYNNNAIKLQSRQ